MAKLLISLPNSRDIIHELSGDVVTVGRSADNKIQINHDSVSGHHAKFILTKGRYRLKDLDSTNKTCINGLPISEAVLNGSSALRFGTVECVFKNDLAAQPENAANQLAEAQRQITALMRARDALHEQNQLVAKQRETLQISNDDLADKVSDIEKEKEQIARERDALLDLQKNSPEKLGLLEQQIGTLQKERDNALQSIEELSSKLKVSQQQLDFAASERDSALTQGEESAAQWKRQSEQLEDAVKKCNALEQVEKQLLAKLADSDTRLASFSKERDEATQAHSAAQKEIETLRADLDTKRAAFEESAAQIGEARQRIDELVKNHGVQHSEAAEKLRDAAKQIEALTQINQNLASQLDEAKHRAGQLALERDAKADEIGAELRETQEQLAAIKSEHNTEKKAHVKLSIQLSHAEEKVEQLTHERDAAFAEAEAKLASAHQRVEQLMGERDEQAGAISDELEKARKQIAELTISHEKAGQSATELTAQLAESKQQSDAIRKEHAVSAKTQGKLAAKLAETEKRTETLSAELDAAKKSANENASRIAETERQFEKTRSEREAANRENEKLAAELAETRTQLDRIIKKGSTEAGDFASKLDDAKKQIDAFARERDSEKQTVGRLASELDAARKQTENLVSSKGAETDEVACKLSEAQKQLDALTRERDGVKQTCGRLEAELEATKKQIEELARSKGAETDEIACQLSEAQKQIDAITRERDGAKQAGERLAAELEATKQQSDQSAQEREAATTGKLREVENQIAALTKQNHELLGELNAHREKLQSLETEKAASSHTEESHAKQLDRAKRDTEELERKYETAFATSAEKYREAKNELEAIRFERATLQQKNEELAERIEMQRLQMAAIRTERDVARQNGRRFETGTEEVEEKAEEPSDREPVATAVFKKNNGSALRLVTEPVNGKTADENEKRQDSPVLAVQAAAAAHAEPPALPNLRLDRKSASEDNAPFSDDDVRKILPAVPQTVTIIRSSLQYFIRHQNDQKLVQQLHLSAKKITETTALIKAHPVHRLSEAVEALLGDFVKFPELINGGTLRSLGMGLESLSTLLEEKNLFRASHLQPAKVFAVDDSSDVQREIVAAAKHVRMKAACADAPSSALAALEGQPFDLIFLDINLPEMSGFDLCAQVRALPEHRKTPIVFITGAGTPENRAQSLLKGGNDFIAKPFDLTEMNVKTLAWVFKGQLELT